MTIDPDQRRTAADAIERLLSGEITNHEFDLVFPSRSPDRAIHDVYIALQAFVENDLEEFRLTGPNAPGGDDLQLIMRCVAFLRTDLPYQRRGGLCALLRRMPHSLPEDRDGVWPFSRPQDVSAATRDLP